MKFTYPLAVLLAVASAAAARAATVQQIMNFGANPSGIGMYLYTPSNVAARPAVLVGVHACHGKGTDVCTVGGPFATQADKYGFLLVCPSAISSDGCWDVHSSADLSHTGSGDASGIISMVNYVVQNKNGDSARVYVAGHSSGGMMTNVLLGSYPDVFKAGAAFAGVPFACFAAGPVDSLGWNATCANGNVTKTGAQWGDLVRAAFPGFTGTRPRVQLWHGTADATVSFHNFGEEIKEWTNVLGVAETPTSTETNAVQSTWIRTRYTDASGIVRVEAVQETGQPHNLVINAAEAIRFFGLDGSMPLGDAGVLDAVAGNGGGDAVSSDASGSGGATGTGGAFATGGSTGATNTGGSVQTGGSVGSMGTGGSLATGGVVAPGGTGGGGTGGSSPVGQAPADGGSRSPAVGASSSGASGGCAGCSWGGGGSHPTSSLGATLVAAVLLMRGRGRRRGRRSNERLSASPTTH